MKFVRNNLVFILFSGVFGLLFLTLFGLSWFLSGSGEETKAKIDEIRTEIENLHYEKLPYVSLEHDLKLATADLDKLASDERAQNRLWKTVLAPETNIAINWKPKSEEVINSTLIRQFARLTKLCSDKNVALPGSRDQGSASPFGEPPAEGTNDFGFGMTAYNGNWPNFSNEEAQKLGIQIEIIKELVGYICETVTDEHSAELVHLTRESVGRTDDSNIGPDQIDLSDYNSVLLKSNIDVESLCFEVCFIGHTSHARTFLNSLRPPYFIRNLIVERESASNAFAAAPSFDPVFPGEGSDTDETEVPVVQNVRSKFTFLIEYVTSVNRNPDEFFRSAVRIDNYDEELLGEFLLKAGHENLIKPLIEFLKKSEDA